MIERFIQVICDNCNKTMTFNNLRILDIYSAIRSRNWAVSKDRNFTFCPECKKKVSNTGRNGVNKMLPFSRIREVRLARWRAYLEEEERKNRLIYEEECREFEEMNK